MLRRRIGPRNFAKLSLVVGVVALALVSTTARGYVVPSFQYNIISVLNTSPGQLPTITFSVTNPQTGTPYDLRTDPAWTQTNGSSRLFLQIGWDTRDFNNTGSGSNSLPGGRGAALPIPVNALGPAVVANGDGTYHVTSPLPIPTTANGTGEVAMEGHPAGQDPTTGLWTVRVPVKSVYSYFAITGTSIVSRRQIVDVNKCMVCHKSDGTGVAPRLTVHGNNRTEEPQVCVVCHNPNQTDIPFRVAADAIDHPAVIGSNVYSEQSIDFKRLIHGIHASSKGFRRNPLVVIGFNHSVFDASTLREYPASLRDCRRCHIDNGTKGTFELPLGSNVLGSTFNTQSVLGGIIDTDPANDVKVTPIAAVCSSCHDKREVISHMISTGRASFRTTQAAIDNGTVRERCVTCHGPGRDKSVRKVHESDD